MIALQKTSKNILNTNLKEILSTNTNTNTNTQLELEKTDVVRVIWPWWLWPLTNRHI